MSETLKIALTRLLLLAEYELASPACVNPPENWHRELAEATKITRQFLTEHRPPPGPFFTLAERPPRRTD